MLIRRETAGDVEQIRAVHAAAFAEGDRTPAEAGLVDALRADSGWLPALSLVATEPAGQVIGHVVCTRGWVDPEPADRPAEPLPALGLGPLGVPPQRQRAGIGQALMHAVLGAADALDEPLVALLGHTDYYPRFGFGPATARGIAPPRDEWGAHFQVRPLAAYRPWLRGRFRYAAPFAEL